MKWLSTVNYHKELMNFVYLNMKEVLKVTETSIDLYKGFDLINHTYNPHQENSLSQHLQSLGEEDS